MSFYVHLPVVIHNSTLVFLYRQLMDTHLSLQRLVLLEISPVKAYGCGMVFSAFDVVFVQILDAVAAEDRLLIILRC